MTRLDSTPVGDIQMKTNDLEARPLRPATPTGRGLFGGAQSAGWLRSAPAPNAIRAVGALALLLVLGCGGASMSGTSGALVAESVPVPAEAPPSGSSDAYRVHGAPDLLPTGITSFGAAAHEGALYVLGGYHGEPHAYVAADQSPEFLRLELAPGARWEPLPGLSAGIQSVALVSTPNGLHRIGGMRAGTEANAVRSVAEHARFVDGAWHELPALPSPRSSHDAIAVGDAIFVVGGWELSGSPGSGRFSDTMLVFRDGAWVERPAPVQCRALALAATSSGTLVALGGIDPARRVSARVDVYDVASETWSAGPDFPGENNGFGAAAVGHGEHIFASGRDGLVWSWTPGDDAWRRVGELTFPRFFHRLVAVGDQLVVLGGIGGMHTFGRTRHVEVLPLAGGELARRHPALQWWTIPARAHAKNRQGALLLGDELVVFGGNRSLGQHDFAPADFLDEAFGVHLASLETRALPPYPAARQSMQTLATSELALSVGGFGHDGEVARTYADSYRLADDAWTPGPGLPASRTQFGLVEHGGQLWVFGGLNYDPSRPEDDQFRHPTEVLRAPADGSADFSPSEIALPEPRRAFAGAKLGARYFIFGGMREGFQLLENCRAFDFADESWGEVSCPNHVRLNAVLVPVGERLVLVGGTARIDGELAPDPSIEVYDPAQDSWSTLALELPFEPKQLQAFPYRGQVLLYSAHTEAPLLRFGLLTLP